jgi:hypothetical protein
VHALLGDLTASAWFRPLLAGDRLVDAGTNREALAVGPIPARFSCRQALSAAASLVWYLSPVATTACMFCQSGRCETRSPDAARVIRHTCPCVPYRESYMRA